MKKKKLFTYCIMTAMLLYGITSCTDNDSVFPSDDVVSEEIIFDFNGTVDLLHNESKVIKIKSGNGSYKVDSKNPEIALAELVNDNEIKITAVSSSENDEYTTIYILDGKGQTAEINVCVSKLKDLVLDISDEVLLYTGVTSNVTILSGNGGYIFEIDKNDIIELQPLSDDTETFSIKALNEGEVSLSVIDKRKQNKNIRIVVKKAEVIIDEIKAPLNLSLSIGSKYNLLNDIIIKPDNASYKELKYTITGESVEMDNGVISAVKSGKSVVNIETQDGSNKKIECVVQVLASGEQLDYSGWELKYSSFGAWPDGGNTDPYKVLNNNPADGWWEPELENGSFIGTWLMLDLKYEQLVGKIRIARRTQWGGIDINMNLKSAKLQGSKDGEDFFDLGLLEYLDNGNDPAHDFENGVWREFVFDQPVGVRYIKITVTGQQGGGRVLHV